MKQTVRLKKDIYTWASIVRAMEAFSALCDVESRDGGDAVSLVFTACRYGGERTVREFENYLIGLENRHDMA